MQVEPENTMIDYSTMLQQMTHSLWAFCAIYFLFIHTGVLFFNSILSIYTFEKSRLSSWLLCNKNIYKNSKTQHVLISRNSYNKDFTSLELNQRSENLVHEKTFPNWPFRDQKVIHVGRVEKQWINEKSKGWSEGWQKCNKGNFMNVNNPLPAKFLHSENVSKGFAYLKTHLDSLLEATSPSRLLGNTSEEMVLKHNAKTSVSHCKRFTLSNTNTAGLSGKKSISQAIKTSDAPPTGRTQMHLRNMSPDWKDKTKNQVLLTRTMLEKQNRVAIHDSMSIILFSIEM